MTPRAAGAGKVGLLGVERKWIFHWDGVDHEPRIWRYRPDLRHASPERVRLAEWQRNLAERWRDETGEVP